MSTVNPHASKHRKPTPGLDRLHRAAQSLDQASAGLASNTRMFRDSIGELKSELTDLRSTTSGYQDALGRIDVSPLRSKLLQLADIADEWAGDAAAGGKRAA